MTKAEILQEFLNDEKLSLAEAAEMLAADYEQDEELTAFTALDGTDFHAAR